MSSVGKYVVPLSYLTLALGQQQWMALVSAAAFQEGQVGTVL